MKVSTLHDLKIVKMQCRYEIKLQEKALQSGMSDFNNAIRESLKISLQYFAKEFAINLAKKIIQNGKRKRQ